MSSNWQSWVRYAGLMLTPILVVAVLLYSFLREPLEHWRKGDRLYDEFAMKEWVREARIGPKSLPDMLKEFLQFVEEKSNELRSSADDKHEEQKLWNLRAQLKQ